MVIPVRTSVQRVERVFGRSGRERTRALAAKRAEREFGERRRKDN